MSKMPLGYRFRAWLLSYWFGSFEGGMVCDTWKRKFQQEERERIIKLFYQWMNDLGDYTYNHLGFADFVAKDIIQTPCDQNKPCCNGFACSNHIALIKGEEENK